MAPLSAFPGRRSREPSARSAPALEPRARASFLALLVLCAGVRLLGLGREGLWEDEIRTARLAALPLGDLLRAVLLDRDFAVPLLQLAATKAGLWLDGGELGLRLPSAVFGVAGMGAVYLLAREAYGVREGWIAASLLAISHEHIYYSREARPYALLVLAVALMLWAVLRAARTRSPLDWILAGSLAALACNAHFLGAFPALAAAAAAVGLALKRRSLRGLWVFVLPFLALVPVWIAVLDGWSLLEAEGRKPLRLFQAPWAPHLAASLGPGAPALFALTAALAGAGLAGAWRGSRTWLWIALLQLALPLILLQSVSFGHGFAPRYLLFLMPVLVVLQARGLTFIAAELRWSAPAAALAALLILLVHVPAWGRSFEPKRGDWRGAAGAVKAFAPERTVVLASSAAPFPTDPAVRVECIAYYLGDPDGFSMPGGINILAPGLPALRRELRGCVEGRPVCALLTHGDQRVDLPYDLDAVGVRGITVLFPRQRDQEERRLVGRAPRALAHAAEFPPESEGLLRGALELARSSTDAAARAALAEAFTRTLATKALAVPEEEYAKLLRLDFLLVEARLALGDLPAGPALWALHQRLGRANRLAAQRAHAAGSLEREIKLVLRAFELGWVTPAEIEELVARHPSGAHATDGGALARLR